MKRFSIREKKLNRKKQVVIGGIVLLLFFGFFLIKNLLAMEYPLVVDGKGITQEEIRFHNHDIDRAIRSRVIFNWAAKEGLADEFSYETFQKSLKTENKERKEIKKKGEPLYGPVEFTPMQYYKRQLGEYERSLKDHMMKRVEKKELYEFYKTHQENFKEVDTVCAEYIVRQDGREIYKESVILDKNNIRAKMEFDEEFVNRLLLLEEGGKVIWSTAQGEEKELYCTSREDGGYLSYEEVSGAVLEQYIANKFEVELQKRISESNVWNFMKK